MQSLQDILVKSQGDKKQLAEYFSYKEKHGISSVPKACLTVQALQVLWRFFRNKYQDNDVELSTIITVIMCLLEFASSNEDKQSWLQLSDQVFWLLDKCLVFMFGTTNENRNSLLQKFLPTLSLISENGHPLSTLISSQMTRPLITLSLRLSMPKNKQASILETVEWALINSDRAAAFSTLSEIGLHMNALSSLVFKVSVETQLSILNILYRATKNKIDAAEKAQSWFAQYPKIQRAFVQLYSKHYSEASGQFLSEVYEVINATSGNPGNTHISVACMDKKSSVQSTNHPSIINSKSKDRPDVKPGKPKHSGHPLSSVQVSGRLSCSQSTSIPCHQFSRVQEPAGCEVMPGKSIPANQSKLLPRASKLQPVKILGESVSKVDETNDSQKTVSFTLNDGQKSEDHKVPTVNQDVFPLPVEKQLSHSSDNRAPRTIQELYKRNLLATPYYPNRQRCLSLKRTSQCNGIKLKPSSTLDHEGILKHQGKALQLECSKQQRVSEPHLNQRQPPPRKLEENEQRHVGRNLKQGNTFTQEHASKHLKEESPRNPEKIKNRFDFMKLSKPPTLSNQTVHERSGVHPLIDCESDHDGMDRIESWVAESSLYLPNSDENKRKMAVSEKSHLMRPDGTSHKHRKCEHLDEAVLNQPKERHVNILPAVKKMDKPTTLSSTGTNKVPSISACSGNSTFFRKPEGCAIRNHTSSVSKKEFMKQSHDEVKDNASNKNLVQKQPCDYELNSVEKNVRGCKQNQNTQVFHERALPGYVRKRYQNLDGNEGLVKDKISQDFQGKRKNPLNVIHSKNTSPKNVIENKLNQATEVKETKGEEIPSCNVKVIPKQGKKRLFTKSSAYEDFDGCSQISAIKEKRNKRFFLGPAQSALQWKNYQPVVRRTKNMWESKLKELESREKEPKVHNVYDFPVDSNHGGKGIRDTRKYTKKCEKKKSYHANDLHEDHKNTSNVLMKSSNNIERKRRVSRNKEVVELIHSDDLVEEAAMPSSNHDTNNKCRFKVNNNMSQIEVHQKQSKPKRNVPQPNYAEIPDDSSNKSSAINQVHLQKDEPPPPISTEDNCLLSKGTNKVSSGNGMCEKNDFCVEVPREKEFDKTWEHKLPGKKVQGKTKRKQTFCAKDLDSGVDVASNLSDDVTIERRNGRPTADMNYNSIFDHIFNAKLKNEQLRTAQKARSDLTKAIESLVDGLQQSVETAKCLDKADYDVISEQKQALEDGLCMLGPDEDQTFKVLIPPDPEPDTTERARRHRAELQADLPNILKKFE